MTLSDLQRKTANYLTTSRLTIPIIVASIVGISTGFVVVGFIKIIELCQTFFFVKVKEVFLFLGAYAVVVIPVIGGILVGPLVTYLAPEAKGHGVPEVMKAILLKGGRIRPIVVIVKAVASAIAIGSGASVGREGPIVQVGSALGSAVAQTFKLSELRVKNLVACGAAAGIAGVFNTPIAGVMFALEVILRDFGARALSTVVVASVSASIVSRIFLGESPAFIVPLYQLASPFEMFLYLGLGILSAFAAFMFISTLHKSEVFFEKWKFPDWLKPAIGGILIGIIGLFYPQIFGTGLHTIEKALHGNMAFNLLLVLIFIKIIATSVSLGSGSSGGVFSPALFMGAVLGGSYGKLFYQKLPFDVAPPGAYALVGMASVFAAAAHAPVTAILIVFEMTGDYQMILPIMVAVVVATSLSQKLRKESIYTIKLKDEGINVEALEATSLLGAIQVQDAMSKNFETVGRGTTAKELMEKMARSKDKSFYVTNKEGELTGFIQREELQTVLFDKDMPIFIADDIAHPITEVCVADDVLSEAAHLMTTYHLSQVPVVDQSNNRKIVGVVSSDDIFNAFTNATQNRENILSRIEPKSAEAEGAVQIRFRISSKSPIAGKALKDLTIPDGVVFISIQRKKKSIIPEGGTILKSKDKVWAIEMPESEKVFRQWLKDNRLELTDTFLL